MAMPTKPPHLKRKSITLSLPPSIHKAITTAEISAAEAATRLIRHSLETLDAKALRDLLRPEK